MLHVALITTSYPEDSSGAEAAGSFVEDFARELACHAKVSVVAASSTDSVSTDGNLTVRRFQVPGLPLSLLNPLNPADWIRIVRTLRAGRKATETAVRDGAPDHVLALWALPSGLWAQQAAARHRLEYSVWALGSDIWGLGGLPLVRRVLGRVLKGAARRYADGLELARGVEQIAGLPCEFLPSARRLPARRKKARTAGDACRLAFLGRWHRNKGVDMLLEALDVLSDKDWSRIAEIRIYGGGPLQERVHAGVRELARRERPVTVGGYLDRDGAADLISRADYLLLPSRVESIPVIFSDAMQLGTPLIATPVGDLPGIFRKHPVGVIAASTQAADFAGAIRQALDREPVDFGPSVAAARDEFDLSAIVSRFVAQLGKAE